MPFQTKLPAEVKRQIVDMKNKGYQRSEIAKMLKINKADVINVLIEDDQKEVLERQIKFQQGVERRQASWVENNEELVKQYKQAYKVAVELKELDFSHTEIAQELNKCGFINLRYGKFAPRTINNLLNNTPKAAIE